MVWPNINDVEIKWLNLNQTINLNDMYQIYYVIVNGGVDGAFLVSSIVAYEFLLFSELFYTL